MSILTIMLLGLGYITYQALDGEYKAPRKPPEDAKKIVYQDATVISKEKTGNKTANFQYYFTVKDQLGEHKIRTNSEGIWDKLHDGDILTFDFIIHPNSPWYDPVQIKEPLAADNR